MTDSASLGAPSGYIIFLQHDGLIGRQETWGTLLDQQKPKRDSSFWEPSPDAKVTTLTSFAL